MDDEIIFREIFTDLCLFFAGLWLILDKSMLAMPFNVQLNNFIVGIALCLLIPLNILRNGRGKINLLYISALIGIWLIAAPFIIGYKLDSTGMVNSLFTGIFILILSAWSFFLSLLSKKYPNLFGR